jgi:hypothetical protein
MASLATWSAVKLVVSRIYIVMNIEKRLTYHDGRRDVVDVSLALF